MLTKSGIYYVTHSISQSGFGPTGRITWGINSEKKLSQEEVEAIIELDFPFAGYGASKFRRLAKQEGQPFQIEVESHASCD